MGTPVNEKYTSKVCDFSAMAAKKNCDLVVTDECTLLVDLDTDQSQKVFERNVPILRQQYQIESVEKYASSGGNQHAIIRLAAPVLDITERLLLQAALGSDPTRELLGLYLHKAGHSVVSVLFRPKLQSK